MVPRRLVSTVAGVGALLLAGCGAVEVAVEDPPAPASAGPSEPPAPPEPTASPDGAPGGGNRSPAEEDPPADPADADPPAPAAHEADNTDGPSPDAAHREPSAGVEEEPTDREDAPASEETAEADAVADASEHDGAGAPAITIASPAAGSEHAGGPVTAAGEAKVYEGTVLLTLVGPDGAVVEEAFTTATAGAPGRGRWSHTFATAADAPGRWRVIAAATDPSDGEGHPPARAETDFHVTGSR